MDDRSRLRAGDADRQQVVDLLQRHFVAGRLTAEELKDRVRQAGSARSFGELDALTRDLPPLDDAPQRTPAPVAAPPLPAPSGSWPQQDVRAHASSFLVVMLLLTAIWLLTSPGGYFWPIWPMLGWGAAVLIHALSRRG